MVDYIIGAVILLIVGCAAVYVIKAKKSGKKCIGCPAGGQCAKCSCSCDKHKDDRK